MLKVGHRGYLQLAEGFDSPRWREGLVIGLQKEWVQTIVRCSEEEVEQFKLTKVEVDSKTFALVEAEWHQLRSGVAGASQKLEVSSQSLLAKGKALLDSDEDLAYATASEPGLHKSTSKKKGDFKQLFKFRGVRGRLDEQDASELARWFYRQRKGKRQQRQGTFFKEILPARERASDKQGGEEGQRWSNVSRSCPKWRSFTRPSSSTNRPDAQEARATKKESSQSFFKPGVSQQQVQQHHFKRIRSKSHKRPWKGSLQLQKIQEEDGEESRQVHQKIRERNRGRAGSRRSSFQDHGLQPQSCLRQATQSPEMSLSSLCHSGSVVATRLQEGSPTNCLDTPSNAPGCTRPGLGNCMATYSCRGAIQEESLRRRPKCPPGCRFISEEPQRVVQIHRGSAKEEPRRSPGRRRKGQRKGRFGKNGKNKDKDPKKENDQWMRSQDTLICIPDRRTLVLQLCMTDLKVAGALLGDFLDLWNQSPFLLIKGRGLGHFPNVVGEIIFFRPCWWYLMHQTQPSSSRRRARGRGREMAWGHVELLWTWFSFLEGGSPFKKSDQEALVARAQQVTWTKMHAEYAGCMHSEISKYIRLQSKQLQLSRGILKLSELVKVVKNSSYTSSSSIEKFCNVAKDVKPDRMSLPEVAGIINPTNYLKGTHKQAFLNMIHDVPLEEEPPDRVQGCFKVNEDDLQSVHFKLLSSGVAVLIPEEMGVRDSNGSLITGGLFAVDHKEHSDRIILDRRPFNQLERRLIWAKLPHGSLLTQLIVPHDHSIRGSGDDLQNYFYLLKHQDNWASKELGWEKFWWGRLRTVWGWKREKISISLCGSSYGRSQCSRYLAAGSLWDTSGLWLFEG